MKSANIDKLRKFIEFDDFNIKNLFDKLHSLHQPIRMISNRYEQFFERQRLDASEKNNALALLFGECNYSFYSGLASLYRGHFTDSNIFSRMASDALQYALTIQEKPESAKVWLNSVDPSKFHDTCRRSWHSQNKTQFRKQFKLICDIVDEASSLGAHPSSHRAKLRLNSHSNQKVLHYAFHEFANNEVSHLICQLGTLKIIVLHMEILNWWFNSSPLKLRLKLDEDKTWGAECSRMRQSLVELSKKIQEMESKRQKN